MGLGPRPVEEIRHGDLGEVDLRRGRGVNWEWLKTDWALLAGYRALSWDYEGANEFKWDMTQHGPIIGLSFGW